MTDLLKTQTSSEIPHIHLTYLILAHSDPNHFGRLLKRIVKDNVKVYVHLDRKADIAPFELAANDLPNIVFCTNRVHVMWGAFSVVTATLNLIEAALAGTRSDYLVLLSGADYPVATQTQIATYFASQKGADLVRLSVIPETEKEVLWRVRGLHFRQLANRFTLRRKFLKPLELALRLMPRQIRPGVKIAVGSQWWALTEDTARYTMNALKSDKDMRRMFKFALAPDELAFHTVLANSPLNEAGRLEEPYQDIRKTGGPFAQSNFHYIDRDIVKGPDKARMIINHERRYLFARKFKSGDSDTALDTIDAILDEHEIRAGILTSGE